MVAPLVMLANDTWAQNTRCELFRRVVWIHVTVGSQCVPMLFSAHIKCVGTPNSNCGGGWKPPYSLLHKRVRLWSWGVNIIVHTSSIGSYLAASCIYMASIHSILPYLLPNLSRQVNTPLTGPALAVITKNVVLGVNNHIVTVKR